MAKHELAEFLAGVIEGFYGQPWTQGERFQLFDWMGRWGLNTYIYGPKDDLKHRAIWRETYSSAEAAAVQILVRECDQRGLHFIYALSPGLDIQYSNDADRDHLKTRLSQMLDLGCQHFALLFDDIPDRLDSKDLARWGSLASAQSDVANSLFRGVRERSLSSRFFFCPTPYCGRMAAAKLGGEDYLATLGRELLPEIDVFWTGPEIISAHIDVAHVRKLEQVLGRKPVIWDNIHANDYDGRRFYCGPYAGRPPELRESVRGLLINPNNEFSLNYVPIRTLAAFVNSGNGWEARGAYSAAMKEWIESFAMIRQAVSFEDLILFGDCFYLPHQDGPEAESLYSAARGLLSSPPTLWGERAAAFLDRARRLRDFCARLTELRDRPLFYALCRRAWDLREELDLLIGYVQSKLRDPDAQFHSDFHLPHTYRGGMVARLQTLLVPSAGGEFKPTVPSTADGAKAAIEPFLLLNR